MSTTRKMYGWHFRPADGALKYKDGRKPKVGERLKAKGMKRGTPGYCAPGMHASGRISMAMRDRGPLLSFVLIEGTTACKGTKGKFVGTHRTILWETNVGKFGAEAVPGEEAWQKFVAEKGFRRASCRRLAAQLGLTGKK